MRRAEEFRCEEILRIERSAANDQYDFSAERIEECLAREVIDDVKADRLADTGGPPLLPIASFVLIGAGIFVGRSVFRGRER